MKEVAIAWFLWSTVYPGGIYMEKDIRSQPVKEFKSQADCEKGRIEYQKEADKAFPIPSDCTHGCLGVPIVILECSPIYPK